MTQKKGDYMDWIVFPKAILSACLTLKWTIIFKMSYNDSIKAWLLVKLATMILKILNGVPSALAPWKLSVVYLIIYLHSL